MIDVGEPEVIVQPLTGNVQLAGLEMVQAGVSLIIDAVPVLVSVSDDDPVPVNCVIVIEAVQPRSLPVSSSTSIGTLELGAVAPPRV